VSLLLKCQAFQTQMPGVFMTNTRHFGSKLTVFRKQTCGIPETDLAGYKIAFFTLQTDQYLY